jgi:hypothetical protein
MIVNGFDITAILRDMTDEALLQTLTAKPLSDDPKVVQLNDFLKIEIEAVLMERVLAELS